MFCAGGYQVEAGSLDGAVSQHISQAHDVFTRLIKCGGKQVPQVVRKYLAGGNPCPPAQLLQLGPDLPAAQAGSVSGEKNLAGDGFLLLRILQQLAAQLVGQQNGADFSLETDLRPPPPG